MTSATLQHFINCCVIIIVIVVFLCLVVWLHRVVLSFVFCRLQFVVCYCHLNDAL